MPTLNYSQEDMAQRRHIETISEAFENRQHAAVVLFLEDLGKMMVATSPKFIIDEYEVSQYTKEQPKDARIHFRYEDYYGTLLIGPWRSFLCRLYSDAEKSSTVRIYRGTAYSFVVIKDRLDTAIKRHRKYKEETNIVFK